MEREKSKTDCYVVSLEVLDLVGENLFELPVVFTRPSLPVTTESSANQQDVQRWQYLSEVKIPNIDADVSLLIGSDTPEILEPKQVIPSQNGGPYATRTTLGWVVIGKLGKAMNANTRTANFIKADLRLNDQFQSYCDMEFNDSACTEAKSMSANDKHAMRLMSNSIKLENGNYHLALPWRNDPSCLENNRSVVGHRLRLLKRRLSRDPELKFMYKDCMEDLMKKGCATKAQPAELEGPRHDTSPTTLEMYVLCSTVPSSTMASPSMTNTYESYKFPGWSIDKIPPGSGSTVQPGLCKPEAPSALRFLWWPHGNLDLEPEEFMMTTHLFGAVSSAPCANFALRKTAADNQADFSNEVVRTVAQNFYVDDC